LDEALCTYNERLYYEQLYPEALDWWWTYRINYYEPSGWVDGSIYNPEGYQAYRNAIYLNGAVFLEELRTLIGDQAFFAFLKEYVNNNRNQRTTADDFFTLLAQHSQEDISVLLNKYFEHR
jgi:aminopeptidase N